MTYLLLLATLLAGSGQGSDIERPSEYFLMAGRVHLGTGEVLESATLHIKDGKIVAVAKRMTIPAGAEVIDCSSWEVMPGMVEGVSHAGFCRAGRIHAARSWLGWMSPRPYTAAKAATTFG